MCEKSCAFLENFVCADRSSLFGIWELYGMRLIGNLQLHTAITAGKKEAGTSLLRHFCSALSKKFRFFPTARPPKVVICSGPGPGVVEFS